MVNATSPKTPSKKRKSMGNAGKVGTPAAAGKTPKKTPGANNITPNKGNANTPATAGKTPNRKAQTPAPTQTPKNAPKTPLAPATNKRHSQASESTGSSPPKKPKMFPGTAQLDQKKDGKTPKGKAAAPEKPVAQTPAPGGDKQKKARKRKTLINWQHSIEKGDQEALKNLELKIQTIKGRKEVTKTALRKLRVLEKLKYIAEHGHAPPPKTQTQQKEGSKTKKRRERKTELTKKMKSGVLQPKKQTKAAEKEDSEEEEDSDYEVEDEVKPAQKVNKAESDDSEDDEEASGDEEEEDDGEEEQSDDDEEVPAPTGKKQLQKGKKPPQVKPSKIELKDLKEINVINKNQTRYVVFVGNLLYETTKQDLTEHFKKAGEIRDVRIPNDKITGKPKGFAYVEFHNEEAYQKGLSLHESTLRGRRINVQYTQPGDKTGPNKKQDVKAKNFKLGAMRKQGQLAGSVKQSQKRSFRRGKNNKVNGS